MFLMSASDSAAAMPASKAVREASPLDPEGAEVGEPLRVMA
jgi:hypothetical protein